jgi:hypothetical protein
MDDLELLFIETFFAKTQDKAEEELKDKEIEVVDDKTEMRG